MPLPPRAIHIGRPGGRFPPSVAASRNDIDRTDLASAESVCHAREIRPMFDTGGPGVSHIHRWMRKDMSRSEDYGTTAGRALRDLLLGRLGRDPFGPSVLERKETNGTEVK